MSKASYQVKQLKMTERTEAWLEAELAKHPEMTAQQILRDRLDKIAAHEIHAAIVLTGIVARRGIRGDGGGQS